jgi:hypothetical protein
MGWRQAGAVMAAVAAVVAVQACGGSGATTPPDAAAPLVTTSTVAPLSDAAKADLAHTFNSILGATNQAIYAFAARVHAGVATDGTSLPADVVSLGATAASSFSDAASGLQQQVWPPALQDPIAGVVSAVRTFAADLQLLAGLSPAIFSNWQTQFAHDGSILNDTENIVRVILGLAPVPTS